MSIILFKNRKNIVYLIIAIISTLTILSSSIGLSAPMGDVNNDEEASSPVEKQLFIGEASDRGNHVYQFEFLRRHFGMYVPKLANQQDVANVMRKYVPENKINKAGYKV